MKKIFLYLVLVIILCGCSRKMTCTYEKEYEDIKIENSMVFNFEDNTYKQIDKMIFIDAASAKNYFEDVSDYIDEYNLVLENKIIKSELEETFTKEKEELKKQYESYEYKCK